MQGGQVTPQAAALMQAMGMPAPAATSPSQAPAAAPQQTYSPFAPAGFIAPGMGQPQAAAPLPPLMGGLTPRIGPQSPVPVISDPSQMSAGISIPATQPAAAPSAFFGQGVGTPASAPAAPTPAPAAAPATTSAPFDTGYGSLGA